ncbi:HAUS augmin-like complex subunit 4 [Haliaeetus albicilla]|uniref:HAUS augmin-like complex subunit 4 n=1 Tax=Haliaeetus albicilla TaxID=8969 RepID=UPI0037E785A7
MALPGSDLLLTDEDPPQPLGGATPQELRAHPGLAELLRGLGCVLGGDGLSPPLEKELRQAEAALALHRGAWLRWESLWRGLRELLRDPRGVEPPVLQELEQVLALAELRRGPPAFAPLLPPPKDPTLLRARLLPQLEHRLAEKVEELSSYHKGPPPSPPAPQNPPRGVAEGLAAEHHRLRRARHRGRSLSRLLERQRRAYPQVLGRCRALLARLAGERFAGAQAELDRRRAEYLEAKGTAVLLKIRLEELNVLLDTYPPEKVEAHRRIRAALEAAGERAAGEAAGARAALAAFGGLGPRFGALAGEYGRLRERLGHRRWALRQLRHHDP